MTDRMALTQAVCEEALAQGFDRVGVVTDPASRHGHHLSWWLQQGYHGDMGYLARPDSVARRHNLEETMPGFASAVVVAHEYGDDEPARGGGDPSRGLIARYARGRDYHKVVSGGLKRVGRHLAALAGHPVSFRVYVDTGPILERELGQRAGLGWFGKNTMLIHPRRGSYAFLGVLLTDLPLEPSAPFAEDHCGSCSRCLDACPTGALLGRDASGAPVMDARRCISYLTIEHRGSIPHDLRPQMGNRVFGCDICQEVCPFTRTFSEPASEPAYAARSAGEPPVGVEAEQGPSTPHPGTESSSLVKLLEMALSESAWRSFSRGSAVRRAGRGGFARNVCVALGNWGSPEAVPVLSSALEDPQPLVRSHAAWALGRVDSMEARAVLSSRVSEEEDEEVVEELVAALRP